MSPALLCLVISDENQAHMEEFEHSLGLTGAGAKGYMESIPAKTEQPTTQ